jgi:predicted dehydrogenase
MKKLKVGIIGLGVGEKHLEAYRSHPSCETVSVCDLSSTKLRSIRDEYPSLKTTKDANDILEDKKIDIVSIASYDNYHHEQIIKALNNGKHVFVEKPLCLYRKEALNIKKVLKKKPHLRLSSNLILRMSPRFQFLKKMVKKGKLGKLFYIEGDYNYGRLHKLTKGWRGDLDFYSIVYGGGVHIIDLMLWLTGDDIVEVYSMGSRTATKNTKFKYNDLVISILKFKSGMLAKMTANFGCVFPHFHNMVFYGTKATFMNDLGAARLITSSDPQKKETKIKRNYKDIHKGELIHSFIESISNGTEPRVREDDVFKAMSVCFAIEESSRKSKKVRVEYI